MRPRTLALVAFCGLAAAALAQNPAGAWNGTVSMELSPEMKAQMKGQPMPTFPKFTMTLKADKTYTSTSEVPALGDQPARTMKSDGTWSQKGDKVTLTAKTRDGKPVTGQEARPQVFTISRDGKTMTLDLSAQFTQGNPQAKGTKVIVTMKKA